MIRTLPALLLITTTLFTHAATAAEPLADAVAAYQRGAYREALPALRPLAQGGDPLAQVYMGLIYYNGHGVSEDDAASFGWFRRAAEQGDAEGQYQLGYMYIYGFGVPDDEHDPEGQAVYWFGLAAARDHAEAQFNLGLLYLAGSGTDRDEETGIAWIRQAANNGSAGAQRFTGTYN